MERLLSPETFEFLARYFLAGWVFLSIRSWQVKGERPRPNDVLFEAITLSLFNQLLSLATLPLASNLLSIDDDTPLLIIEVFLQPAIIGFVIGGSFGWLADRDALPDGIRRLFMPSFKPVSEAYAFAFDQLKGPAYVIMSYPNERAVYGYFGTNSIADSDPTGGGIFIELLYSVGHDGQWVSEDRSAWLSFHDILSIEFISEEEN